MCVREWCFAEKLSVVDGRIVGGVWYELFVMFCWVGVNFGWVVCYVDWY